MAKNQGVTTAIRGWMKDEAKNRFPPRTSGGSIILLTPWFWLSELILYFWLPKLWENKFLLLSATKFVVMFCSSHRKLMQYAIKNNAQWWNSTFYLEKDMSTYRCRVGMADEWKVSWKGQYLTGSPGLIKSNQFKIQDNALLKVKVLCSQLRDPVQHQKLSMTHWQWQRAYELW